MTNQKLPWWSDSYKHIHYSMQESKTKFDQILSTKYRMFWKMCHHYANLADHCFANDLI